MLPIENSVGSGDFQQMFRPDADFTINLNYHFDVDSDAYFKYLSMQLDIFEE